MTVDPSVIAELQMFSTPSVLNGLKRLGQHPSQFETMDRIDIRCMAPALGVHVGLAATKKMATSRTGSRNKPERNHELNTLMDLLILGLPEPRILVVENIGDWRGPVCIWGEVTAHFNLAMGCTAGVTNGPVRDLTEMEAVGFQTFAGGPGVGGGFVDTIEVGGPVKVGGITVRTGDLIHADQHGVVKVPLDLAAELPGAIRTVEEIERRVIETCHRPEFSVEAFTAAWTAGGQK